MSDPIQAQVATLTNDPYWVLIEDGFTLAREHEVESLSAIGNGYLGSRGSLAEGCSLSAPATFVAGAFDTEESSSAPALVRVGDWTRLSILIEGEALQWIEVAGLSIAVSSTYARACSGGNGGSKTKRAGSLGWKNSASPPWRIAISWCNR